jgi:hypothetical protein
LPIQWQYTKSDKSRSRCSNAATTTATTIASSSSRQQKISGREKRSTCLLLFCTKKKKLIFLEPLFKSSPSRERIELSMMLKPSCDAATKGYTQETHCIHHHYQTPSFILEKPTNPYFRLFFSYKSKFAASLFLNLLLLSYFCGSR